MSNCCDKKIVGVTTLPNGDSVYTCSSCLHQDVVVADYRIKYSWMVTDTWDVLHYVPTIVDWDDNYWELHEKQFDNDFRWKTLCGIQEILGAPGIFSRMGRPRCEKCCILLGITQGVGCPINDKSCTPTRRCK